MKIEDIDAVILSGGKSSRMGKDKSLLPFKKYNTLIEYQYNKLSEIFHSVYISSKIDKFDFLQDSSSLILDRYEISSPMVALEAIFQKIQTKKVFLLTVDTPLVSSQTITTLVETSRKSDCKITLAKDTKGILHNLCGVFDKVIYEEVVALIKQNIHKIQYLEKKVGFEEVRFDSHEEFLNINTPKEYHKALKFGNLYSFKDHLL